jgi:hypothetical protein
MVRVAILVTFENSADPLARASARMTERKVAIVQSVFLFACRKFFASDTLNSRSTLRPDVPTTLSAPQKRARTVTKSAETPELGFAHSYFTQQAPYHKSLGFTSFRLLLDKIYNSSVKLESSRSQDAPPMPPACPEEGAGYWRR